MGTSRLRILLTLLAVVGASGCIVVPAAHRAAGARESTLTSSPVSEAREADRLLTRVRDRVIQDNTGMFNTELHFGDLKLVWHGDYWLREARAEFEIEVVQQRHEDGWTDFEVVLDRTSAYLRKFFYRTNRRSRWIRVTKRHIFPDLQCWPARDRQLPDRMLMLLFNAEAQSLEREEGRSFIVATVPARLTIGVFRHPSITELISRNGSRPVTIRIGHFRDRLTGLELQGRAVKSALKRTGIRLDANLARRLQRASYNAWYSEFASPVMMGPPGNGKVVDPGNKAPAARQICNPTPI
jgi:hypothetical protein